MLQHVGDHAQELQTNYGNVSAASIGAIQRGLLALEQQGARRVHRRADAQRRRPAPDRRRRPRRRQHPRRRQAHECADALLDAAPVAARRSCTSGCPKSATATSRSSSSSSTRRTCCSPMRRRSLLDKIEQVVRLIRSKGVGVYFVTQNPLDMPGDGAGPARQSRPACAARVHAARPEGGQGGRRNHARQSRSSTPKRRSPSSASAKRWSRSSTPRAARRWSSAPTSCRRRRGSARRRRRSGSASWRVAGLSGVTTRRSIANRPTSGSKGARRRPPPRRRRADADAGGSWTDSVKDSLGGLLSGSGRKDSIVEAVAKSAARTVGSTIGREIVRGVLGSLLGGRRR